MVAIMTEPAYAESVWGKNLYLSLVSQLRIKRIPFLEITDSCPAGVQAVFVIAASLNWTRAVISQLNQAGHQPILICNQSERIPGCLYSCVCSDVHASMRDLMDMLHRHDRTRIALYGAGVSSIADRSRMGSLFSWQGDDFPGIQVFQNEGSLSGCFDRFYARRKEFDAVVCMNDYAALSLVRSLKRLDPDCLTRLTIVSCAGTKISEYYRAHITSLSMSFEPYGKAALALYECLLKNPFVSCMTVSVSWLPDSENALRRPSETALTLPEQHDQFYDDPEISDMLIVDRFLNISDATDRAIVSLMLRGETYQTITEACFLTESAVKYRLKRLTQLCGAENKSALLGLIRDYLGESL